jgi:hypothetical protein
MPSFKTKATKKIKVCKKYSSTLDGKHTEFVNEFAKNEMDDIPRLKEERHQIKLSLENSANMTIEEIMEMRDRISEITASIKKLKDKKINYYLDNSKYIFEYFQSKKNINNIGESAKPLTSKNQLLFSMFKVKQDSGSEKMCEEEESEACDNIVQKYLTNIDETFLDMNLFVRETDICQHCGKGEMVPLDDEGILICNECAVHIPYLIENEKPSYKEPPKEVSFYAYKKINHFKEILAQFQGKETTYIPDELIQKIQHQIKKERLSLEQLKYTTMKEILRKLEYNDYYEHIAFIKNKLGIKPPVFSPELEEMLCNLFMDIQEPYAKHCPDYRVNFLSYNYILLKLLELLDETQYIGEINMLKDREKIIDQDEVWKKICQELDWDFIPTV